MEAFSIEASAALKGICAFQPRTLKVSRSPTFFQSYFICNIVRMAKVNIGFDVF